MRAIKTQKGFTIVETMIVLAITSVLLISTTVLIAGQIEKYRFRTSVATAEQIIRASLNDTADGLLGNLPNATAANVDGGSCTDNDTTEEGNSECIYIGKSFDIDTTEKQLVIESLVANADIEDIPKYNETDAVNQTIINLPKTLEYTNKNTPSGFPFYLIYNNYKNSLTNKGGAQYISLYITPGGPSANFVKPQSPPPDRIPWFCVESGSRNAKITIGDPSGNYNIRLDYDSTDCTTP